MNIQKGKHREINSKLLDLLSVFVYGRSYVNSIRRIQFVWKCKRNSIASWRRIWNFLNCLTGNW